MANGEDTRDHPGRQVPRERFGIGDVLKVSAGNMASSFGMAPEGPVTPFGVRSMMRGKEDMWRSQTPEWNETMAQSPGVGGAYGNLVSTARRNAARNPR